MNITVEFVEKLKLMFSLIDAEEKWTKYALARDAFGKIVEVCDESAVCFCSVGAMDKVLGYIFEESDDHSINNKRKYSEYLYSRFSEYSMDYKLDALLLATFNDCNDYQTIRAAWVYAIEYAEKNVSH